MYEPGLSYEDSNLWSHDIPLELPPEEAHVCFHQQPTIYIGSVIACRQFKHFGSENIVLP